MTNFERGVATSSARAEHGASLFSFVYQQFQFWSPMQSLVIYLAIFSSSFLFASSCRALSSARAFSTASEFLSCLITVPLRDVTSELQSKII